MKIYINGIEIYLDPKKSYKIVTNEKDGLYVYEYNQNQDLDDEDEEPIDSFVLTKENA